MANKRVGADHEASLHSERLCVPLEFETQRLLLRCPRAGDGAVVYASVVESLDKLREFPASLPWAMAAPTVEQSEAYCQDAHARFLARTAFPFLAFTKEEATHVGNLALHDVDWSVPKCEIGYWVRASLAGRGLMTEAVAALATFGFDTLGMRRIQALPEAGNIRSCRLCERAGFVLEGTLRNHRIAPDGCLLHTRVYAAIR